MQKLPVPFRYIVFITMIFIAVYLVQDYSYYLFSSKKPHYNFNNFAFFTLVYATWAGSTILIYNAIVFTWRTTSSPLLRIPSLIGMSLIFGTFVQIVANLIYHILFDLMDGRLTAFPWADLFEHVQHGYLARTMEFWVVLIFFWVFRNVSDYNQLFPSINKLKTFFIEAPEWKEKIPIQSNGNNMLLPIEEVEWIEATGNYVTIHTFGKKHLIRGTLNSTLEKLDPEEFTRIQRSLVVRNEHITQIESKGNGKFMVEINNGPKLESGRSYRSNVEKLQFDQRETTFAF